VRWETHPTENTRNIMPADMNDYFKKKRPNNSNNNGSNNNSSGGGNNFENRLNGMGKGAPWIVVIIAIIFGIFVLKPFSIINSGEVGIKINTGKFEDTPLTLGFQ
jgi:hypothetical protein